WRTSSSQTARGNWSGGTIPAMLERPPLDNGLRPIRDSWSSRVSFQRFLKALNADLSTSGAMGASAAEAAGVWPEAAAAGSWGCGSDTCLALPGGLHLKMMAPGAAVAGLQVHYVRLPPGAPSGRWCRQRLFLRLSLASQA